MVLRPLSPNYSIALSTSEASMVPLLSSSKASKAALRSSKSCSVSLSRALVTWGLVCFTLDVAGFFIFGYESKLNINKLQQMFYSIQVDANMHTIPLIQKIKKQKHKNIKQVILSDLLTRNSLIKSDNLMQFLFISNNICVFSSIIIRTQAIYSLTNYIMRNKLSLGISSNTKNTQIKPVQNKNNQHLFNHLLKQYKAVLCQVSIGEYLNLKQIHDVMVHMGYIQQNIRQSDYELIRTIAWLLTQGQQSHVSRQNLFRFFMVISDVKGSSNQHFDPIQGVPADQQTLQEPMVPINIGSFDSQFKWSCSQQQAKSLRSIFHAMIIKKISNNDSQSKRKNSLSICQTQLFQPKILSNSVKMAQSRMKKLYFNLSNCKVQDRLIGSQAAKKQKIQRSLSKSLQKQMIHCTFKPNLTSNKQNSRIIDNYQNQNYADKLLHKGKQYQKKRQRLKSIQIKLNQSVQLTQCTFKPSLVKRNNSIKKVQIRDQQKAIERLKKGRKQRQFVNQVKQRGYPNGVSWNIYLRQSKEGNIGECMTGSIKQPILCIDLRLLNEQHNIDVYEGQNIGQLAQRIGKQNSIPIDSWWKVEQLIRKSIEGCSDVLIKSSRIHRR